MNRTTRKDLDSALHTFESMLNTLEKLTLDSMNPGNGRTYVVEDSHGRRPLGQKRRSASEMLDALHVAINALEYKAPKSDGFVYKGRIPATHVKHPDASGCTLCGRLDPKGIAVKDYEDASCKQCLKLEKNRKKP